MLKGKVNMENKITVCVADADQAYRTELCDFLKKQGDICLIGDTADGREALAMVEAQHPAVLVLDTVLPGLDGTGILRRLKGKSETRCIVVTEFRTAEAARDIRDAGAYVFLPKPADDTQPGGARHSPRDRGSVGPRRPGNAAEILWLYGELREGQAHKLRIHRHDRRSPPITGSGNVKVYKRKGRL